MCAVQKYKLMENKKTQITRYRIICADIMCNWLKLMFILQNNI